MSRFPDDERQRLRSIGVPPQIIADLEAPTFDPARPPVLEAVRFFQTGEPRETCILSGAPGVGKSAAAAYALAHARVQKEVTVLLPDGGGEQAVEVPAGPPSAAWVLATEVLDGGYNRDFGSERAFQERVRSCRLLVIDELGAEILDAKGTGAARFVNLVCLRASYLRKTLITSNLTAPQLLQDYCTGAGERLKDRLLGQGHWCFAVAGESLRRARAAAASPP